MDGQGAEESDLNCSGRVSLCVLLCYFPLKETTEVGTPGKMRVIACH